MRYSNMEVLGGLRSQTRFDTGAYSRYLIETILAEADNVGYYALKYRVDEYLQALTDGIKARIESETADGKKSFFRPRLNLLCYSTFTVLHIKCQTTCDSWPEELTKTYADPQGCGSLCLKRGSFVLFVSKGPKIFIKCLVSILE